MAFTNFSPALGVSPISQIDTAVMGAICRETTGSDPAMGAGTFIYLKGVAGTARGSFVVFSRRDGTTVLLQSGQSQFGPVAVAMGATVANTWGWYQIVGRAVGKVAAGFVDNALVYATATAGTADDAVIAGARVKNAKGAGVTDAAGTGLTYFEIDRPFMDNGAAA